MTNITLTLKIKFLSKKINKMLLLVFLGLLMAYLNHQRFRSYFKTKITALSFIRVKTDNNHAFFAKAKSHNGTESPIMALVKTK